MAEITWAPWSCSGLLPTSSPQTNVDFLISYKDTKLDIAILVQTHHKDFQEISSLLQTFMNSTCIIQTETTEGDPYTGIAVLISNKFTLLEPSNVGNYSILSLNNSRTPLKYQFFSENHPT